MHPQLFIDADNQQAPRMASQLLDLINSFSTRSYSAVIVGNNTGRYLVAAAECLSNQGHRVFIACTGESVEAGVPVITLPPAKAKTIPPVATKASPPSNL